jgi:ATP-dependent Zn protease
MTPPKRSAESEDLYLRAVHESGHVLAALRLGLDFDAVKVSAAVGASYLKETRSALGGFVSMKPPDVVRAFVRRGQSYVDGAKDYYEKTIVVCYAGVIAECVALNKYSTTGRIQDFEDAEDTLHKHFSDNEIPSVRMRLALRTAKLLHRRFIALTDLASKLTKVKEMTKNEVQLYLRSTGSLKDLLTYDDTHYRHVVAAVLEYEPVRKGG